MGRSEGKGSDLPVADFFEGRQSAIAGFQGLLHALGKVVDFLRLFETGGHRVHALVPEHILDGWIVQAMDEHQVEIIRVQFLAETLDNG